jgi:phage shock protein A
MPDVTRETYRRLMAEIEDLEDRVADLDKGAEVARNSPNPQDAKVIAEELESLRTQLAAKRNELQRISDGCGKPNAR